MILINGVQINMKFKNYIQPAKNFFQKFSHKKICDIFQKSKYRSIFHGFFIEN